MTGQPFFANAVAHIEFQGEADSLLEVLKDIEERLGREPGDRYGPRLIDLDILLFGGEEWVTPDLTIPHPRLLERDFVVYPLLEIEPDIAMPDGTPITRQHATEGRIVGDLGPIAGFEGGAPRLGEDGEPLPDPVPTPEEAKGEWVSVGPPRYEANMPNSSTDFVLLLLEAELKRAGIPCAFTPHRPNEGFSTFPGIRQTLRLMVPADREADARRVIAEVAAAEGW
jgi:hypothetical protein